MRKRKLIDVGVVRWRNKKKFLHKGKNRVHVSDLEESRMTVFG
jgi:hypothetical protein